ncbi:MAG: AsmA-like C-terminal domain-containing protein [Campylobacterota bacterium]|nr:AsmA-like C-terminal domain-containing protein [Campylobacterota bacterium]
MNDNIIISIISKTYFNIVSLFIFIFGLLLIVFITLQNGLFIGEITLANVHVEQLYIKWNNKIDISAKEISIEKLEDSNSTFDSKDIKKYLKLVSHSKSWFNSIVFENISYNHKIHTSFKYREHEYGFINVSSDDIALKSSISLSENILHLSISELSNKQRKIEGSGDIYLDTEKITAYTNINLNISNDADLNLYSKITPENLFYKFRSNKNITNIDHLIKIANLPKEVNYWAHDAIDMQYLNIKSIHGYVSYNDLQNAYKNLYVKAVVNRVNYKYNPKLEAIHAKNVILEFKNGILYIFPKNASTYGTDLATSSINIDFTKEEELLTLNLFFDAMLNQEMLTLLETYKIKLPFKQNSGSLSTDLKLIIGLRSIDVEAIGKFYTKKANFHYLGLDIDISNALINLNNSDISVQNMDVQYKTIAQAKVNVSYNAQTSQGAVDFLFNSINLKGVSLKHKSTPLKARYSIASTGDSISVDKSDWKYQGSTLSIDPLSMSFDLQDLKINIPATMVQLDNIGNSFVSGSVDLKTMSTLLQLDILKFEYDGVKLSQSNTPIKIKYNTKLSVYSDNTVHFTVGGSKYKAKRFYVDMDEEGIFRLKHTSIEIGKYIKTKVYAKYNNKTKKSNISLSNFTLKDPNTQKTLYKNSKIILAAQINKENILITSKELDTTFVSQDTGWRLELNSIGRISSRSSLLEKFKIEEGSFTLYKNNNDKYTRFNSSLVYPFGVLVKNNIPMKEYHLEGRIYKEKVYIDINDIVHIEIKDTIDVDLKNSVINIQEALNAIKSSATDDNEARSLDITLKAKNSHLYVNDARKIIYDSVDLQYCNDILTAQLKYDKGDAGLRLQGDDFHLYGKNFNDDFMNNLFALSHSSEGRLSFSISGKVDNYEGTAYIEESTITDYKTLNNILAFVNTIPSLITFNVPGYSKDGIYIKEAYVDFTSKENNFDLKNIFLDSKEIDILGKGSVDITQGNLDVTLNLKTDLGSDLAKVPLVGHILLGEDSISTTLKITGPLADPNVESLIAQEIIVAPINIIKRTLALPYNLIEGVIDTVSENNMTKE